MSYDNNKSIINIDASGDYNTHELNHLNKSLKNYFSMGNDTCKENYDFAKAENQENTLKIENNNFKSPNNNRKSFNNYTNKLFINFKTKNSTAAYELHNSSLIISNKQNEQSKFELKKNFKKLKNQKIYFRSFNRKLRFRILIKRIHPRNLN